MPEVQAKVVISGKVQGVWFRAHTEKKAQSLKLLGYVRNLPTGQVEAVFQGLKDIVDQAISWCHEGSPNSRVTSVEVEWQDALGDYQDFAIRY